MLVKMLSGERCHSMFNALPNAILLHDFTGQVVFLNTAAEALFGYTLTETPGLNIAQLVPASEIPAMRDRAQRRQRGEENVFQYTARLLNRQREALLLEITSRLLPDDGTGPAVMVFCHDTSRHPRIWTELSAALHQHTIADALRDAATLLNSTLRLDEVLDRILELVGRVVPYDTTSFMVIEGDKARIIRHRGFEAFGVSDHVLCQARISINEDEVLRKLLVTRSALVIPDVCEIAGWHVVPGTEWIRGYIAVPVMFEDQMLGIINVDSQQAGAYTDEDGNLLMAFANQASVALRNARHAENLARQVEERTLELDNERQRLKAILDATGEGIYYTEETTIAYVNSAFCEMIGYTSEELIGQSTALLIGRTMDEELLEQWKQVRERLLRDRLYRSDNVLVNKAGQPFDVAFTLSLVGQIGDTVKIVTQVRDIRQQKQLDAQKMRFIASAAHELRNPIAGLSVRAYLMRRQPDRLEDHLRLLEATVERLKRLSEDLLDIARFENGVIRLKMGQVILQPLVEEVFTILGQDAGQQDIALNLEMPDEPIYILLDSLRIHQVVYNLVANALNYTPAGGRVNVRVAYVDENTALIQVNDTGRGIAQENLTNIFEPFFRVTHDSQGTGLGLSIVREIVHRHNGRLTVESTLGVGSTFSVYLPLIPNTTL